jgi:hypothetical protein
MHMGEKNLEQRSKPNICNKRAKLHIYTTHHSATQIRPAGRDLISSPLQTLRHAAIKPTWMATAPVPKTDTHAAALG